jgi:hypothetical protein
MKLPSILLGTAAIGAGALCATAFVVPTIATSASKCDAALFTIKAGMPGAGSGYAKAKVSAECSGSNLVVTSNGMPSYAYVAKTPNGLKTQSWKWTVPAAPKKASKVTSIATRLGTIGFTVTGIPIYGPMEGPVPANMAFGDPVYNGILDSCKGHTGYMADYHDHAILATASCGFAQSKIVGYAIDGFPIYGASSSIKSGYVKTGNPKTNSWTAYTYKASSSKNVLDKCNGRTEADGSYAYHATSTFPYTIGCFKGTPVTQQGAAEAPMPPMS